MKKLLLGLGTIAAIAAPVAAVVACGTIENDANKNINLNSATNVVKRVIGNIAKADGFNVKGLSISVDAEDNLSKLDGLTMVPIKGKDGYFFADSKTENMNRETNAYGVLPASTYGVDKDAEYMVKVVEQDGEVESISSWRLSLNTDKSSLEFTNSPTQGSTEVQFVKQEDTRVLTQGSAEVDKVFAEVKEDYVRRINKAASSVAQEFYTNKEATDWSNKYGVDKDVYFEKVTTVLTETDVTHTLAVSDGEPMIINSIVTDVELFDDMYATL